MRRMFRYSSISIFITVLIIITTLAITFSVVRAINVDEDFTVLNIPEVGVSLKIKNDIRDLTYSIDASSVPGVTFADLSTKSLSKLGNYRDSCGAKNGAIGALWLLPSNSTNLKDLEGKTYKQLGGSYIVYQKPQSGCSDKEQVLNLQLDQISDI